MIHSVLRWAIFAVLSSNKMCGNSSQQHFIGFYCGLVLFNCVRLVSYFWMDKLCIRILGKLFQFCRIKLNWVKLIDVVRNRCKNRFHFFPLSTFLHRIMKLCSVWALAGVWLQLGFSLRNLIVSKQLLSACITSTMNFCTAGKETLGKTVVFIGLCFFLARNW